ncbi:MAG: Wzz/FepE/Etk N-terminal domain-containing protein [Bacteroidales bacterium]
MDVYKYLKLLWSKIRILVLLPMGLGALAYGLTRNLPRIYSTEATIYTGITSGTSILDMQNARVDYFATQNAYNNVLAILKSQSVLQETALRLFTLHLMSPQPDPLVLSEASFLKLEETVPDEVRSLVVPGDFQATYGNIQGFLAQDKSNFIYGLLHYNDPHYSIKALSAMESAMVQGSDLVRISFKSDDPVVSYQTVRILCEVFIDRYNDLKKSQSHSVVAYFEQQLDLASGQLKEAENKLLQFNTENDIINYYEQTKHVSSQQEKIDVKLQDIRLEVDAAISVLARIETEIENNTNVNLRNNHIVSIREELIRVNDRIAIQSMGADEGTEPVQSPLGEQRTVLETRLRNALDSLHVFSNKSEGVDPEIIFGEWLEAVKEYESTRAMLRAMEAHKAVFMEQYKTYAPLGASLKGIEREIDVLEQEYLEILHQLGLARLKEQNSEMASDMEILDQPGLPINPLPSKRKMIIMVLSVFGLVFYVTGLFLLEMLDKRVRTPERLEKLSGLRVLSAFADEADKRVNHRRLREKGGMLLEERVQRLRKDPNGTGSRIHLFSLWEDEGISRVGEEVAALGLSPVTLPPLSEGIRNPEEFQQADLHFLVVDASRIWTRADQRYLDGLREKLNRDPDVILTRAHPDDLEDFYGEIPRHRSKLRVFLKKTILKRFL